MSAADASATHRVLLVGMMGSGKSTIGKALGERTGWPYLDNDELLERATGRTAREILGSDGPEAMRRAEADAVAAGLRHEPPVIVATAAGTVLDPVTRAQIRDGGLVVWLHADPSVLAERAIGGAHRPWLDDDPIGWFTRANAERDPLYREIADVTIDTGTTPVVEGVARILAAVSSTRA